MQTGDTICAISSGLAPSARIIVRMSGGDAVRIATKIIETSPASGVSRVYLSLRGCEFPAIIYRFDAPRTVTGEDIIEFHLPGNVLLARWTLEALISAGARQAEPGEFTARAYFNGKIDLAQAEGVAATVFAHSEAELSAARQLMAGELSRRVKPFMEMIADTLALVEAGIDFTDEDISFISPADAKARIEHAAEGLRLLLCIASRLEPLTQLANVVLVGRPNAGKSTLLNALAGENRAVVSPVSGTTRDVLSAVVSLNRGSVELIDVAGVEESPDDAASSDAMRQIARDMQQRALQAVERADVIALVRAIDDASPAIQIPREPDLVIRTKSDLFRSQQSGILVSALTGKGISQLRDQLDELVFGRQKSSSIVLNDRHLNEIGTCIELLARAADATAGGAEFLALELRQSLDALGRILGEITPDDVLGRVFSTFCIGK